VKATEKERITKKDGECRMHAVDENRRNSKREGRATTGKDEKEGA